jgi:hypothetical protein
VLEAARCASGVLSPAGMARSQRLQDEAATLHESNTLLRGENVRLRREAEEARARVAALQQEREPMLQRIGCAQHPPGLLLPGRGGLGWGGAGRSGLVCWGGRRQRQILGLLQMQLRRWAGAEQRLGWLKQICSWGRAQAAAAGGRPAGQRAAGPDLGPQH